MIYRKATGNDTEKIALLHAQSWQQHYRGILSDKFLDGDVGENRLATWESRLQHPAENQYVILAEEKDILCGFACVFADDDPLWGALLDNLHVVATKKGQGIGTKLLKLAAQWAYHRNPATNFYLWVFEKNSSARRFYEGLGAVNYEVVSHENPGGGSANACRYVWTDVRKLLIET
jgi:GNAT superfamily N-acetyltransferase